MNGAALLPLQAPMTPAAKLHTGFVWLVSVDVFRGQSGGLWAAAPKDCARTSDG